MHGLFVLLTVLVSILTSNGNIIEQGVPYRGTIKPYETQKIIFSSGQGLKRVLYFQCTGSADLSIVDSTLNELEMFKGTTGNAVVSKGAPPHKAVLEFDEIKYTFNLLGKRSSIDSTNTFQLYVYDNYAVDSSLIMLGDTNEVFVQVDGSNVTLEWNEPIYDKGDDILNEYCLYSLEKPYGEQLDGDWLACGHEIKSSVADSPDLCTTAPKATFTGLLQNRSHYFWVVAKSNNGSSTAYPFVRVDMEGVPFSRTLLLTYSLFLVLLSVFFVV
ncbi:hypothetical protein ACHWQZ_G001581 [Mnemiopsis leidyi]